MNLPNFLRAKTPMKTPIMTSKGLSPASAEWAPGWSFHFDESSPDPIMEIGMASEKNRDVVLLYLLLGKDKRRVYCFLPREAALEVGNSLVQVSSEP